jgi:hypothetical protein
MSGNVIPFRRPAGEPPDDRPPDGDFEEVTRVQDQSEALVVRSLLEAHGIQVVLRTHVAPSVHPFTVGDQAEVRICVPRSALAQSRLLLTPAEPDPPAP